ncbi:GNAT family N-acetyltransferase [Rhizobium sp. FKY42]|uniref:GNAT family N-acetyltransferase n=1 Tax=Rhizobium sp. FKY42 TaxID=2562310 RepID=UPI0010C106B6|nr:GNAT family N-acetyltransferase [Rhizobium sp. FKY42]
MVEVTRLPNDFTQWSELLALILSAFAYMDARIDPPSSAHKLTVESLRQKGQDELCYIAKHNGVLVGCIFCRPELPNCLYIGKLAISKTRQGQGLGRQLLAQAEQEAIERGLAKLRLETRIELVENHATFRRWGFEKSADRSHPGYDRITFIEMIKAVELVTA